MAVLDTDSAYSPSVVSLIGLSPFLVPSDHLVDEVYDLPPSSPCPIDDEDLAHVRVGPKSTPLSVKRSGVLSWLDDSFHADHSDNEESRILQNSQHALRSPSPRNIPLPDSVHDKFEEIEYTRSPDVDSHASLSSLDIAKDDSFDSSSASPQQFRGLSLPAEIWNSRNVFEDVASESAHSQTIESDADICLSSLPSSLRRGSASSTSVHSISLPPKCITPPSLLRTRESLNPEARVSMIYSLLQNTSLEENTTSGHLTPAVAAEIPLAVVESSFSKTILAAAPLKVDATETCECPILSISCSYLNEAASSYRYIASNRAEHRATMPIYSPSLTQPAAFRRLGAFLGVDRIFNASF